MTDKTAVLAAGSGDVRAQTRRTLENVKAILAGGGASVEGVMTMLVEIDAPACVG